MKKNFSIVAIIVMLILLSFCAVQPVTAGQVQVCGELKPASALSPRNCPATVITDSAWVSMRSGGADSWWIYKLNFEDRVVVQNEENGYYFVIWKFDLFHDPIVGWVEKEDILLDRDVQY